MTNTVNNIESLWPSDFISSADTSLPVMILRQQAAILGQLTHNILEGVVESSPVLMARKKPESIFSTNSKRFNPNKSYLANDQIPGEKVISDTLKHNFYIKAPVLGGYRYNLFYAIHKLDDIYPVDIYSPVFPNNSLQVIDEKEFCQAVSDIFNSEKTKKIVQSLLAQSQA